MTIVKGFLIVVLSAVAFAFGGAAIGYALGTAMPGYYRGVYPRGQEAWFDPVAVGLGQGLTQGVVCGVLVGCVVVLAVAWQNSRRRALEVELRPPVLPGSQGIKTRPAPAPHHE
jgi:hypothetical protein